MRAQGEDVGLCMVPEETVGLIARKHGLHIKEERWNADYVIDVETAHALKGRRYGNLRRRMTVFESRYSKIERADLDLQDPHIGQMVRRSVEGWMSSTRSRQNDPGGWEARAIEKHLDLAGSLPIHGLGVFVGDRLVSVSIYHYPPHPGWVILNHIKCDYRYKGVFGYSFCQVIRQAYDAGKTWLNGEQDLDRPALRLTKSLLRPHQFLRRYSVSLSADRS
jgi:hypothetical protein